MKISATAPTAAQRWMAKSMSDLISRSALVKELHKKCIGECACCEKYDAKNDVCLVVVEIKGVDRDDDA